MKKNILLMFVFLALTVFVFFFAHAAYTYYQYLHSDDPIDPYLRVMEGNATIVRGEDLAIDMGSGEVYDVIEGDIIITKSASYALLNWPDRSKTRLGPNTRLTVNRMRVASDYSSIEIELAIEEGKIWTNVVRTIYPGSYFRTKLPSGGIIAGVRGTTFDINLDLSYIRSVDHSISLSDSLGHSISLLPGEAVSAKNILEKVSSAIRDRFWIDYNTLEDNADELLRTSRIDDALLYIRNQSQTWWGRFVQWILSWFDAFKGIEIMTILSQDNLDTVVNIPEKYLTEWYQHFQDTKFVQQRENIRLLFLQNTEGTNTPSKYRETFARAAMWDVLSFSGMNLESTTVLINQYAASLDERIKNVLNVIPINELDKKAKETLRSLIQ